MTMHDSAQNQRYDSSGIHSGQSENRKIYKSTAPLVLLNAFSVFLFLEIAIFAIFAILKVDPEIGHWILGIGLPFFAAIVFSVLFRNIQVDITDSGVEMKRRKKIFRSFSYNREYISSYILRQTINLIPMLSTKYLRVIDPVSKMQKNYQCYCFSKQTFDKLIADVSVRQNRYHNSTSDDIKQQTIAQESDSAQTPCTANDSSRSASDKNNILADTENTNEHRGYHPIPKDDLINGDRKRMHQILGGLLIVSLVIFILYYFGFWRQNQGASVSGNALLITAAVVFIGFVFIPFIVMTTKSSAMNRKIPSLVQIDETGFAVDNVRFNLQDVTSIRLTPPAYSRAGQYSHFRSMEIDIHGKKYFWLFGSATAKHVIFPGYEAMCKDLENLLYKQDMFIYKL